MDLSIISVESIKPSFSVYNHKPFKLSLLDQFAPTSYSPLILLYPTKDTYKTTDMLNKLKISLSKTLNSFYPVSGRVEDNLFISNYTDGVPFTEARVKGTLSDFLEDTKLELLNNFIPYEPMCLIASQSLPQAAIQANIFDCGGMALGMCFLHKIFDGITLSTFLQSWAADARGSDQLVQPNLFEASSVFPPLEPSPPKNMSYENLLFKKGRHSVKRFVFCANAIAALRAKSKSDLIHYPSSVQALSAFLWKSEMAAHKKVHNSQWPSIFMQAKEIRQVAKPNFSEHAIGNLFWIATTRVVESEMELSDLLVIMREALKHVNSNFLSRTNILEQLRGSEGFLNGNLNVFSCSSWKSFYFDDIDFGWGKPIWSGLCGKTSETHPSTSNLAALKHVCGNKTAMEAWIVLEEEVMAIMEKDPEFLNFASPCDVCSKN